MSSPDGQTKEPEDPQAVAAAAILQKIADLEAWLSEAPAMIRTLAEGSSQWRRATANVAERADALDALKAQAPAPAEEAPAADAPATQDAPPGAGPLLAETDGVPRAPSDFPLPPAGTDAASGPAPVLAGAAEGDAAADAVVPETPALPAETVVPAPEETPWMRVEKEAEALADEVRAFAHDHPS